MRGLSAAHLETLEKRGPLFWMMTGSLLVAGVGLLDIVTGSEISFSFFYLVPIAPVAWFAGRSMALVISVLSALTWFGADAFVGQTYSAPGVGYWNAAVRLGFFVVVSALVPAMRTLEGERALARVDELTGAPNRRRLLEVAHRELDRAQRYKRPFTLGYIDLDGFKVVNDRSGHETGDEILRALARRATLHLRKTDLFGRIGGDEFIVLLPETSHAEAKLALPKLQAELLDEMRRNHWPVTLSIGALTYRHGPITTDELIARADSLMYEVKKKGKNAIAYAVWSS